MRRREFLSPRFEEALLCAAQKHAFQARKGSCVPYIASRSKIAIGGGPIVDFNIAQHGLNCILRGGGRGCGALVYCAGGHEHERSSSSPQPGTHGLDFTAGATRSCPPRSHDVGSQACAAATRRGSDPCTSNRPVPETSACRPIRLAASTNAAAHRHATIDSST